MGAEAEARKAAAWKTVRNRCNSNTTGYQKIEGVQIKGSWWGWRSWHTCDVYIRAKHGNGGWELNFADPNHLDKIPEGKFCWDGYEQTQCYGTKENIALFVPKGHTLKGDKEFKSS